MFRLDSRQIANQILSEEACRQIGGVFAAIPHPEYQQQAVAMAEQEAAAPLPVLPLTEYLAFSRDGNRTRYEAVYFARRNRALKLLLGELADGKQGRFIPAIMDTLWAILEEATWVIPAHNLCFATNQSAPHEFGVVRHVDLFSSTTAAVLGLAAWYLEDQMEERMPRFFMEHLREELIRRVFEPYCSDATGTFMNWKGLDGNYVNNWNPWIGLSLSTAALFGMKEEAWRQRVCQKALFYANNWLKFIPENGTCLEGPNYFFPSNGAFWDLLELMRTATGGKVDFRTEPAIRNMVCSVSDYYVGDGRWVAIADCGEAKVGMERAIWLARAGKALGDDRLVYIAQETWQALGSPFMTTQTETSHVASGTDSHFPLRTLQTWSEGPIKPESLPQIRWDESRFDPANQHYSYRKGELYFRLKGGHNHEPHGHNDVGEFMVYVDNQPVLVDPGHQTYCADTFNHNRYSLWYNRSDWHNTPVINGTVQHGGPQLLDIPFVKKASQVIADEQAGRVQMELKHAYPDQSGIVSLVRQVQVQEKSIAVTDRIRLAEEGEYAFHLVSLMPPKIEENHLIFPLKNGELVCEFTPGFRADIQEQEFDDSLMVRTWNQHRLYRTCLVGRVLASDFVFTIHLEKPVNG